MEAVWVCVRVCVCEEDRVQMFHRALRRDQFQPQTKKWSRNLDGDLLLRRTRCGAGGGCSPDPDRRHGGAALHGDWVCVGGDQLHLKNSLILFCVELVIFKDQHI